MAETTSGTISRYSSRRDNFQQYRQIFLQSGQLQGVQTSLLVLETTPSSIDKSSSSQDNSQQHRQLFQLPRQLLVGKVEEAALLVVKNTNSSPSNTDNSSSSTDSSPNNTDSFPNSIDSYGKSTDNCFSSTISSQQQRQHLVIILRQILSVHSQITILVKVICFYYYISLMVIMYFKGFQLY